MTYQIVRITLVEGDSPANPDRHYATRFPNAYETAACAHAIAGRMHDDFSDEVYYVIPWGGSPWSDRVWRQRDPDEIDLPF
jgi:hypothetical protein